MEFFPIEVNRAPYEMLLRVPGIGVRSAKRILIARRAGKLDFAALKKLGVVLKRAQYFLTCSGKMIPGLRVTPESAMRALAEPEGLALMRDSSEQLSFFSAAPALSHGKENSHEPPLSLLA